MIAVGVDPGAKQTGVVVRDGDDLLASDVIARTGGPDLPPAGYLREVVASILGALDRADVDRDADYVVGVEGLRYWPGYRNVNHLLGTAATYGAVLLRWPAAVIADPGQGYGGLHPQVYPAPIRPPKPWDRSEYHDKARHARSAWDISHVAQTRARQEAARG